MTAFRTLWNYVCAMAVSLFLVALALWKATVCMVVIVIALAMFGHWPIAVGVLVVACLGLALFTWAMRDGDGGDEYPAAIPVGWLIVAFVLWIFFILL